MEQKGFDVESWLAQAKEGRDQLVRRKRELMEQRNAIDEQIAQCDAGIAKIDEVAGPALGGSTSGRVGGVQKLVRATVHELAQPHEDHPGRSADKLWDEEHIITEVLHREPMMKPSSIRSSLRTLVGKKEIERHGKRGSHTYRWASHGAEQPSMEDRIRTALANAGNDGVTEKGLGWKAGDADVTGTLLDSLVTEGVVEKFPVGEGEWRFRIVPRDEKPEDQKTLFGGPAPAV